MSIYPYCNATFAAFLADLAAKNLKIACPNCGRDDNVTPPSEAAASPRKPITADK
jgi:hypothetical protein